MLNKRFWTSKNLIFTGLVIVLLLILPKIVGILMLFFGAYVIACALNPYVTKLMVKMKNRTAASSLVILSSVLAIIALFIPIVFVETEPTVDAQQYQQDIENLCIPRQP